MDFEKTEEGLKKYIDSLREIAVKRQLNIGFETESNIPLQFKVFVKDYNNNLFQDFIRINNSGIEESFKLWNSIESLLLKVIVDSNDENCFLKMMNGSIIKVYTLKWEYSGCASTAYKHTFEFK